MVCCIKRFTCHNVPFITTFLWFVKYKTNLQKNSEFTNYILSLESDFNL